LNFLSFGIKSRAAAAAFFGLGRGRMKGQKKLLTRLTPFYRPFPSLSPSGHCFLLLSCSFLHRRHGTQLVTFYQSRSGAAASVLLLLLLRWWPRGSLVDM
jgi:hypothetical protein